MNIDVNTIVGIIVGSGGTGVAGLLITRLFTRRKDNLDNDNTVITALEKENARLNARNETLEQRAVLHQDRAYRYRGLLAENRIQLPEDLQ